MSQNYVHALFTHDVQIEFARMHMYVRAHNHDAQSYIGTKTTLYATMKNDYMIVRLRTHSFLVYAQNEKLPIFAATSITHAKQLINVRENANARNLFVAFCANYAHAQSALYARAEGTHEYIASFVDRNVFAIDATNDNDMITRCQNVLMHE